MKKHIPLFLFVSFSLLSSCSQQPAYDASGTFEVVETIISSGANGTLMAFDLEEGESLKPGQYLGYVDSLQLYLRKKQFQAQIQAVLSRQPNIATQLAALQEQLLQAEREKQRVANLLKADAATQKQLDDAKTQIAVIHKQMTAQQSTLRISSNSLWVETLPLQIQIEQLDDQLSKCRIINEIDGTVLVKYAHEKEMTSMGKPLYKIADLSTLVLRAYITGGQFSTVKLGQKVNVMIDQGEKPKPLEGTVEWISNKAEFTPKTIQTKDERANLVYAIKIRVKNDGSLKIGMYGEVTF